MLELYSGDQEFKLIGYSFGSLLTLEIAKLLESNGKKGSVTFIDGSPQFLHKIACMLVPDGNDEQIQLLILLSCVRILAPTEFAAIAGKIIERSTWDEKMEIFIEVAKTKSHYSVEYGSKMLKALINRVKMCLEADKMENFKLMNTSVSLLKSTESSLKDLDLDYGLGEFCEEKVVVVSVEGNHTSILHNSELMEFLNK